MWRAVCLCVCLAALGRGEDAPSVVISQGRLKGTYLQTRGGRKISAFQGIPYASPPVGPLRFHKPLPAGSWEGERDATLPGNRCLQFNHKQEVIGNEDCLYINVYTHKTSNESKVPVLVFIHGGGFIWGWGDQYLPDFLMDKDIVLVTFNYRLGALGFLSMENKDLPGNNGLKDQTAALRWVKDNIAEFGGDPGAVTLSGESAGAASVHYHMLSPLSKGLFHRAIAQSGTAYCPWATQGPGDQQAVGERFAAALGCNHHSVADTLDCLRDMPAHLMVDIVESLYEWQDEPQVMFQPVVEPKDTEDAFLSEDPWTLSSDLPWIAGVTSGEGAFKVQMFKKSHLIELNDDFEMIGPLTLYFRSTAEDPVRTAFAIKKFYFLDGDIKPDDFEGLTKMYSDSWFVYPVLETVRRHKGPTYLYFFDYRGPNSIVPHYSGVSHFDEIQYFFPMNQFPAFINFNISAEDHKMSEKLIDLWVNFVVHGKPTLDTSEVNWTETTTGAEYLHMKKEGFTMEKDILKERDDFWKALPYRNKYVPEPISRDEL